MHTGSFFFSYSSLETSICWSSLLLDSDALGSRPSLFLFPFSWKDTCVQCLLERQSRKKNEKLTLESPRARHTVSAHQNFAKTRGSKLTCLLKSWLNLQACFPWMQLHWELHGLFAFWSGASTQAWKVGGFQVFDHIVSHLESYFMLLEMWITRVRTRSWAKPEIQGPLKGKVDGLWPRWHST